MKTSRPEIRVAAVAEELNRLAGEILVERITECLRTKEHFSIALSGGSTPKGLYALLATRAGFRERIAWQRVHFFWGDERHVPPDHSESNYRMAYETMLSKVPVPPANIHRVPAEHADADRSALEYEEELIRFFKPETGGLPRLDCALQGIGTDGHTASLFPGTEALQERERLVVANWVKRLRRYRITMTLPLLNHADFVFFLVSGEEKAEILRNVLVEDEQSHRLPAQMIQPTQGRLLWLVDRAAASRLPSGAIENRA
jgi:6-phosphogluconolactonase